MLLTDVKFHLDEIVARLRAFETDGVILASITDKIHHVAYSYDVGQSDVAPRPFLPPGVLLLQLRPLLDATKHLQQEAIAFVTNYFL